MSLRGLPDLSLEFSAGLSCAAGQATMHCPDTLGHTHEPASHAAFGSRYQVPAASGTGHTCTLIGGAGGTRALLAHTSSRCRPASR
jgi:hypothetical protein